MKLGAALAVGLAITFFALDGGPTGHRRRGARRPRAPRPRRASTRRGRCGGRRCLLSALAFLCLPRQFHVAIVENADPADVRTAAWAFPLYLAAISLFVLPVALAGLVLFPERRRAARHLHGGDPGRARLELARARRLPRRALGLDGDDPRRHARPRDHARQRHHRAGPRRLAALPRPLVRRSGAAASSSSAASRWWRSWRSPTSATS